MTRTVVAIVLVAALAVALALALSERRVQTAFDVTRRAGEGPMLDRAAAPGPAATGDGEAARVAEARERARVQREAAAAQHEALATLRWTLPLAALLTLLLGLGLSLRLIAQATRLAEAAERIARGKLDAPVPAMKGPFALLAPTLRRTASALARREREADALTALAALPSPTNPSTDLGPAHEEAMQLGRLLESVRQAIAGVLDVRALTLVAVDGERVRRLATSQRDRQAALYARAGSAVAAMQVRGDAIVFDVDRGVHPEDATARAAGARAYAVLPLARDAGDGRAGALVVDLGLCAVAVAELRFLGLVAHELAARLARTALDRSDGRVAEVGRVSRSQ